MAKQFILLEVGALSTVQQNLRSLRAPFDFTIENVEVSAGANVPGDATFNLRSGASVATATTIFASPADRPKILSGQSKGETTGLSVVITKDTWLVWDIDAAPIGGISAPVSIAIRVEDGTAVQGAPGSQWLNGAGAPASGLGLDGDYYLRTSNDDVYFKSGGAWAVIGNIKGSAGTAGSAGAAGQGFTYRGDWASGTAYAAYDVVTYNGSAYLALNSSTGVLPSSDVTKWAVFAAGGNVLAGEQDVAWSNISSGVSVDSNNTLTNPSAAGAGVGAQAVQTITGIGGFVRFKVGDPSESTRYAGLRYDTPDHNIGGTVGWTVQIRVDATIKARTNGVSFADASVTTFSYTLLDELEFECFDSGGGTPALRVKQNGTVVKTYTDALTFPLYFDVEFAASTGQHIYNPKIKSVA
jgi:hypothetical protein